MPARAGGDNGAHQDMLRPADFRRIALGMNDAIEGAHMAHPDFRSNGRVFATLCADGKAGMVKLTPQQQQEFVRANPTTFVPASGAWGRKGCTTVRLDSVDEGALGEAMTLAWQNTARARAAGPPKSKRSARSQSSRKR